MKTFTTYAEKKAKQILNLLQGYTKGIRITAILILLLMGVSNAWAYNYGGTNVYYYFANTASWSGVHLYIWNGDWHDDFTLTKIANTNVYYHKWSSAYNNNEGILFRGAADWSHGQTGDIKASYTSHTSWVQNSTTGSTDLSNINRQAKVVAMLSTGGNYTATANANCTATVSGYTVEKGKSTATSKSASTSGSANNASISAAYGSTITYTATAGTGYTFKGFSTSTSTSLPATTYTSGKTATASAYGSSNNTTYYAYFKANQYTVKFDANGGSGTMSNQSYAYGVSQALTANAFTRTGYTFAGWNTKADGTGTSYTDKQSVSNLSSTDGATVTLYAQWKINTYTVSYGVCSTTRWGSIQLNSETAITTTGTKTLNYGTSISFTATPNAGYQVEGWYSNSGCTSKITAAGTSTIYNAGTLTANKTVYVKFEAIPANSHNITYTAQGTGWTYGASNPTSAEEGATVTFVVNPTAGYRVDVSCSEVALTKNGNNYTFTMPGNDVNIKVEAKPEQYTVTLDNQGATTAGTTSVTATYNADMPSITKPTKTGYTFGGYYTATNGGGTQYYKADGTSAKPWTETSVTKLYAKWTANKYTVKFNANNGTGTMSDQSFTYDVEQALTANAFTRRGYTFLGWSKTSSGEVQYTDKQTVKNLTATNNSTVNLYAVWQALPPTPVILKPNDQWKQANARYAIYYWGDGTDNNGWVELTDLGCSGEYFTGEVPASYLDFKFVRLDPSGKDDASKNNGLHWDYKWNETENLTTPAADKNMYDMTSTTITHLYLKPNEWSAANAWFATYLCNGSEAASWHKMTILKDYDNNKEDIYSVEIGSDKLVPSKNKHIIFVRKDPSKTGLNWDGVWNQTADLNMPTDGSNFFSLNNEDWSNGTWSTIYDNSKWTTYTVPTYTITINAPEAGSIAVTVGGNTTTVTDTPEQITNIAAGTTFTIAYTPNAGFELGHSEVEGIKEAYDGAGTYTVCGPVDITAHFVTEEDQVVYLRPNGTWLSDNAIFYAYVFNRYGDDEWIELTTKETDYTGAYGCTIPAGYYSDVIFVRINPTAAEPSWDDGVKWNQTVDYVIPVNTTTNRFIIGEKITAEGADKDKYQGSWEASDTPIYGIPGDWQGTDTWAADEYPLMGPDGLVTVNITQTNDTLGFKVYRYPYGTDENSYKWLGNNGTMVRGGTAVHEGGWTMETNTNNCGLAVDVAGDYVFHFNIRESKLTVQYPPMPVPSDITLSAQRIFEDAPLNWIEGNGTEANPYQLYVDETARITITGLADVPGLTTCYRVGDNEEQTSNIIDFTNILTEDTAYTVYAYYKNAMGATSDTVTEQTPYIKGLPMPFYLMTSPSQEINIDRIAEGENILVQFRSDAAATVGLYLQINDSAETKLTDITNSISKDYTHDVDDNIKPCILHYIARSTTTVHGRTFEAKADVAIYKNVIIKVHDPEGWVKNAYMWRDYSDAVKTQWPGEPVLQNFGTWRVFSVKYPYYDRFIVNDGNAENSTQTIDWELPDDDTCYELLDPANNGSSDPADTGKYGLEEATCPADLIVEDIKDTTIMEGEQIVVMPKIYVGLGYKLSDVRITQLNAINPSSVRADISGTNIVILGYAEGESNVNVTYNLNGTEVQKTFKVTVEKNTNITIQVKVPNFGDGPEYQWTDGSKYGIRYWGAGIDGTDLTMDYAFTDGTFMYAQAQIPIGTDGKINFHFYYESHSDDNAKWRQTTNVDTVRTSGCYTLKQGNDYYRHWKRTADYCFDDENYAQYQVKVFMPTLGKEYSSNIVTNTTDTLSFFAPGENETGYRAGNVQLYKNKKMIASIPANNFPESNVYTATIAETGDGLDNVSTYSGNFYIRTYGTSYKTVGFNNGKGWNSIKDLTAVEKDSVRFTKFTSREGEFYNHYWVQAMNTGTYDGKDVSACVANEYNDDLAGKLLQDKHTDEKGDIKVGKDKVINVRFGYDPRTNYFGRAILQGSEFDTYLNIHCDNAYRDKDCTPSKKFPYGTSTRDNKMYDISTWVYQRDIYVPIDNSHPSASLYLEATSPSTERDVTDHLLGYVTNEITGEATTTPIQKTIIGSGTTNGTYLIRVVYDFKTNRLIAAWLPQGTVEVDSEKTLNADVLFVREENNEVPQIQLSNQGKIKSLESMFFAMELLRGDSDAGSRRVEQYWFTLPFDCKVGSISGVPGYLQIWGIQRYRGDLRAQKGWYAETPTFWEWLDTEDVMHAGEGYLLVFDKKNAPFKEIEVDKMDAEGNIIDGQKETISMMRLYFPSMTSGFDMQQQSAEQLTRTYENHTCTLKLHDRYLQDSNWKVIGTTSYNNAGITGYTVDTVPEYKELSDAPSFRYSYDYNWENGKFTYEYTPENGETAIYQSFYGYMVQFAGTINWQPIMSETVPEGIAARRYVPANERTSFTTRLEIANAEGEKQDQTFVALDEKATTTFDQNLDLNKVMNSHKANIYTLSEGIPFAGNTLPMEKATVPIGVRVATAGEYTFRMPDGTAGISVTLVDNVTGTHTDMLMDEYTITLDAGTIENRFYLVVDPDRAATSVENIGEEAKGEEAKDQIKKFLIDGQLFIRTADGIFDAKGQRL